MLGGAIGRRVSAGRLGERLGPQPGQDRSAAWSQLAAELPAWPSGSRGGIHVKVTAGLEHVCAETGSAMSPSSAAVWNADQMPGLA